MCYFECTVFFVFSFAFGADFQLEEQLPQLSKVVMTPRQTTALRAQESPPAVGELARDNRARVT
jgi:hypothetical protein